MKLFGRMIRLGDPPTSDIVIYDETNSHIVRRALNAKYSVSVLKVRPEDLRIGRKVLAHFFRALAKVRLSRAVPGRGVLRHVLSQLRCVYLEACLTAAHPRAVVTFIDNAASFGWLSRTCGRFPFVAIQNGSRLRYAAAPDAGYYLQHLFCFGRHEVDLFPKLGYHVERFHPVGSLLASLHFEPVPPSAGEYDLLVVSTWRGNIGFAQDVVDTMRSMRIMDELLADYITARRIKAAVILRAERGSEDWMMAELGQNEEEYYRAIYGDHITIIETDFVKRNVFPVMQRSGVIVSCLSTALIEAFGIGKRVLYCNFTGTDVYHCDLNPAIVTDDDRRDAFFGRLDALAGTSEADYARRHQALRQYYMSNPDTIPTYRAIAEAIDGIIAARAVVA